MLGFKKTSILFACLFLLLLIASLRMNIPLSVFVSLSVIYLLILAFGSAKIDSGFFIPVICRADTTEKSISITFDDGPVAGNTAKILDVLKMNEVTATFFCIGKNITQQIELVKRIDQEGHLLGNHSFSHDYFFDFFSCAKISEELKTTNDLVVNYTQKNMRFFRPPYGVTTPNIAKAVKDNNFVTIGWSVRSMDTITKRKDKLLAKSTGHLKPGDIILFHDSVELTLTILQEFIDLVRKRGFKIVRLDQLLNMPAYA